MMSEQYHVTVGKEKMKIDNLIHFLLEMIRRIATWQLWQCSLKRDPVKKNVHNAVYGLYRDGCGSETN